MKIGIITWYGVTNYGSALQAYALQRLIEESGHTCKVLRHPVHEQGAPERVSPSLVTRLRSLRQQTPGRRAAKVGESAKTESVAQFRQQHLNVSDEYIDQCEADLAIIGSDQIFDIRGFHAFQFGIGVKAREITTYAPSFGEVTRADIEVSEHKDQVRRALLSMTGLSARDSNTKAILEHLTGRSVPLVLDPTLVYDFATESSSWLKEPPSNRYVAIYTWGGDTTSSRFAKSVRQFAKRHGLKTVSVGDRRNWCDISVHAASPMEFFSIISQASVVITNMFHGTCFALRAQVPVLPIVMPHNANKLGDLLTRSGMNDWRVDKVETLADAAIPEIDYGKVDNLIQIEKANSMDYLRWILDSPATSSDAHTTVAQRERECSGDND